MMHDRSDARTGAWASVATAAGVLLSGPLAMAFLHIVSPQPAWAGPDTFVAHYQRVQMLPYALGVVLVGGSATMTAALARSLPSGLQRDLVRIALSAFVVMIGLNYVLQTTFVPSVVASYIPEDAPLIERFSMGSPRSIAWALEMWGYAFLGVATWLVAPALRSTPLERLAAGLCVANGLVSVAGGLFTAHRLEWVFSPFGFVCFGAWNVVMLALAVVSLLLFRERAGEPLTFLLRSRLAR